MLKRLPIFLLLLAAFVGMGQMAPEGSGFQFRCVDDDCVAAAATSLGGIFGGVVFGVLIFLLPRKKIEQDGLSSVGIFRRLGALYVDMFAVMLPLTGLFTLPILFVEAAHVGEFHWSFYREFSRDTDMAIALPSVLVIFLVLIVYHIGHLVKGRATLGQYVLGYRIVGGEMPWTKARAFKRMGWTFLTLAIWPIAIFVALNKPGKLFWFDLKTASAAERTAYFGEGQVFESTNKSVKPTEIKNYGPKRR